MSSFLHKSLVNFDFIHLEPHMEMKVCILTLNDSCKTFIHNTSSRDKPTDQSNPKALLKG